jgi:hypothetical protein
MDHSRSGVWIQGDAHSAVNQAAPGLEGEPKIAWGPRRELGWNVAPRSPEAGGITTGSPNRCAKREVRNGVNESCADADRLEGGHRGRGIRVVADPKSTQEKIRLRARRIISQRARCGLEIYHHSGGICGNLNVLPRKSDNTSMTGRGERK